MTIHELAKQGDLTGIRQAIANGAAVDAFDSSGQTPLMVAGQSSDADIATMHLLVELGADPNAVIQDGPRMPFDDEVKKLLEDQGMDPQVLHKRRTTDSVLGVVAKSGDCEKLNFLLSQRADATFINSSGYSIPLHFVYGLAQSKKLNHQDRVLPTDIRQAFDLLVNAGADINARSKWNENPVSVCSRLGLFALIDALLRRGADPAPLGWTRLMTSAAIGTLTEIDELLSPHDQAKQHELMAQVDALGRTALLLSVQIGDHEKVDYLLSKGSNPLVVSHDDGTALHYAIANDDEIMLSRFIHLGCDIEHCDTMGGFPLIEAARQNAVRCVTELIAHGADVKRLDEYSTSVMASAASMEVVEILERTGACLSDLPSASRRMLTANSKLKITPATSEDYQHFRSRTFGKSHPARMNNPFWEELVRQRINAFETRRRFNDTDSLESPVWCCERYGQSLTHLPCGSYVEIGGEHEDFYDPDFCIYNDVIVTRMDGQLDIYGYPQDVFIPTDFHTATFVDPHIYIIGCLGYPNDRRPGQTPIYRLNCATWRIETVESSGENPGWICKHQAEVLDDGTIKITGGEIWTGDDLIENANTYRFQLSTRVWSMV